MPRAAADISIAAADMMRHKVKVEALALNVELMDFNAVLCALNVVRIDGTAEPLITHLLSPKRNIPPEMG